MFKDEFDAEFIGVVASVANTLKESASAVENDIKNTTDLNDASKKLLSFVSHLSLNGLSQMYNLSVSNMYLFNDIGRIIDRLPEEFHELKKQYKVDLKKTKDEFMSEIKEGIALAKDDVKFLRWEKRAREDEVKDKEKIGGDKQ
jgi:hypothetical protein